MTDVSQCRLDLLTKKCCQSFEVGKQWINLKLWFATPNSGSFQQGRRNGVHSLQVRTWSYRRDIIGSSRIFQVQVLDKLSDSLNNPPGDKLMIIVRYLSPKSWAFQDPAKIPDRKPFDNLVTTPINVSNMQFEGQK
jgi:hypothetical protein